ncbi:cell division suppressor protein YneA [Cytobacillus kochii]|uniref:cell division suppressor protein YneA n=1 Tax=Cytobacillus kochii TaxID=859143 RepID=UPI001CD3EE2E|nr:LysM peptidoglycan-binding domain-containing protein [Cytobacillus kochii]MCA1025766.1 LysM peptidoglycan-binding domain-containing protein [Cytobacillus kochii]MCM3321610.1 LysM peptidoglycan-binding domain-containing protein [Cytobacillus kochii]MCM3343556.1 LysM peptidoglycan-binding domain-containing protein [Cytobacillus kochii]MDM5207387.1 LysM peptidoglycan-binding domain-containing protein [Cytobacillus kochii]
MIKQLWNSYSYAIILIAFSFGMAFLLFLNTGNANQVEYVKVEVKQGDSLWKMAEEFKDAHNMSSKDFVAWVEEFNHIHLGKIHPGDKVYLPITDGEIISETNLASVILED